MTKAAYRMSAKRRSENENDAKFFLNVASIVGLFITALYIASPILKVIGA